MCACIYSYSISADVFFCSKLKHITMNNIWIHENNEMFSESLKITNIAQYNGKFLLSQHSEVRRMWVWCLPRLHRATLFQKTKGQRCSFLALCDQSLGCGSPAALKIDKTHIHTHTYTYVCTEYKVSNTF
jgi:hypothetical protein